MNEIQSRFRRDRWAVIPDFLDLDDFEAMRLEAAALYERGAFHPISSAHFGSYAVELSQVCWIDRTMPAAQRVISGRLDALKRDLNGLYDNGVGDFICQYAVIEPGALLCAHVDCSPRGPMRASVTIYLNDEWSAADGGEIRIRGSIYGDSPAGDVLPLPNVAVCLDSRSVVHEVLPPKRRRLSLTAISIAPPNQGN